MSWLWPSKKEKQTWMPSDYMGFYLFIAVFVILVVAGTVMWIGEIDSSGIARGSYNRRTAATITGPAVLGIACALMLFILAVRILDARARRRRVKEHELRELGLINDDAWEEEPAQTFDSGTEVDQHWNDYEDITGREKEIRGNESNHKKEQ
jgi:hypothetical protein